MSEPTREELVGFALCRGVTVRRDMTIEDILAGINEAKADKDGSPTGMQKKIAEYWRMPAWDDQSREECGDELWSRWMGSRGTSEELGFPVEFIDDPNLQAASATTGCLPSVLLIFIVVVALFC